MKTSELIADLQDAINRYGDLPVRVSVDLSTLDEATHGHRAFGDICDWTPGGGRPAPEIVVLAECGSLNFKPMDGRITELERDNKGWEDECRLFKSQRDELEIQLFQAEQKLHHLMSKMREDAVTQPMGRKPSRFPGKTDNHPRKPLVNWWENEGPDANKTRAKVEAKKEIETEINDSE